MQREAAGHAQQLRYINNGSNKATRKKHKGQQGQKEEKKEKGANTVVASSSIPFALSVPVLNSSQASLQPFGLRLTVRSLSFFLAFSL